MGGGSNSPNRADYEAGIDEKFAASAAYEKSRYFKETFQPLISKQLTDSLSEDFDGLFEGRANADAMQTLTSDVNKTLVENINTTAERTLATIGSSISAMNAARLYEDENQTNALNTGLGIGGAATQALSTAAKLENAEVVNQANANSKTRLAKSKMIFDTGMSMAKKAAGNYGSGLAAEAISTPGTVTPSIFSSYSFTPANTGKGDVKATKRNFFGF